MSTKLEIEFNALDPRDLKALTEHAIARVGAGEWSPDIARVIAQQVATFHGDDALEAFADRIAREIDRRPPL